MTPKLTPEAEAHLEIQKAITCRYAAMRNMRSHKRANFQQALSRVGEWVRSYPKPSRETLRRFLSELGPELDRIITGDEQGRKRRARIHQLIEVQ